MQAYKPASFSLYRSHMGRPGEGGKHRNGPEGLFLLIFHSVKKEHNKHLDSFTYRDSVIILCNRGGLLP